MQQMMNKQQQAADNWFRQLRDSIRRSYQQLENEYCAANSLEAGVFECKQWDRQGGGGGEMSIMRGQLFEKVGVNISTVYGEFSEEFRGSIAGTENKADFFATGLSIVSHMRSPHVPAAHFNTRFICTEKTWFGGGGDLTPIFPEEAETKMFHNAFKSACDKHDARYYDKFKKQCDEYFFLKHRNEARGVGGIFYDYVNSGNFENDLNFTKDVGLAFKNIYPEIIKAKMDQKWTDEQRQQQLIKRGRYVEFNLLYDRGTTFGLKTGGNTEAILMSMPPEVKWP